MMSTPTSTAHAPGATPAPGRAGGAHADRTWCGQLELSGIDGPVVVPDGYPSARLLMRLHGQPVGFVTLPVGGGAVTAPEAMAALDHHQQALLDEHLASEGLGTARLPLPSAGTGCPTTLLAHPPVSVVVCTRERADILRACLGHLRSLTYPALEVVVVDNAPQDASTRDVVSDVVGDDARFRYVVEPRPGLSRARNRGWRTASHDIVAYTDDDVSVEPDWVHGLVRGFARREDVGCVSGLVCTASIEGAAESYFDARVSWSSRSTPATYDLTEARGEGPLYPFSAGIFGTGANFAFRRQALEDMGGFDDALGAGTLTRGGEDLAAFVQVLLDGRALAYEPGAVVWHHHRESMADLQAQMWGYGTGFSAYATKLLLDRRSRGPLLRAVPSGLLRLVLVPRRTRASLPAGIRAPRGLLRREVTGMLLGPYLYLRARTRVRRAAVALA